MTQEEKELLLKDLCARLPYNVMVDYESNIYIVNEIDPACKNFDYITVRIQDVEQSMLAKSVMIEDIKPYLRPMSSMTEEEKQVLELCNAFVEPRSIELKVDFYNQYHFDYRGLIEKGLALEAHEGIY